MLARYGPDQSRAHPGTTWTFTAEDVSADGDRLVAAALVAVRVDGAAEPLTGRRRLTLAPATVGGWRVVDDQPVGPVLPWDLGAVDITAGERSTVLAVEAGASAAAGDPWDMTADADAAVRTVSAAWGPGWARHATVVVVEGGGDLAAVLGRRPDQVANLAALATDAAVVVDATALARLGADGRAVLLAHEVTHLATRAAADPRVPTWLEEGFADQVALAASAVPPRAAAAPVLDRVRARGLPAALPADADFTPGGADLGAAYAGAWLACRAVVERYGLPALVRVYRATAARTGPAAANVDAALQDELGLTTARLTALWRQDLAGLAR